MRDRRQGAEKPESIDDLIAQRDKLVNEMMFIDDLLNTPDIDGMTEEDLTDKWIGKLRSYEFICQKIEVLQALDVH